MTQQAPLSKTSRRPLLWWSLGLLAVFVAFAAVIATNPESPIVQPLDDAWRRLVGVGPDSGAYTWFLPMFLQQLGQGLIALSVTLVIVIVLCVLGRWRSGLFFLSASLLGPGLISQTAKALVDRPRPADDAALGLFGPLFEVDHGSFPSGHAVTAGVIAITIGALIPASRHVARRVWWVVGALLVIGMIWQRTLVNAHWVTDAMAGTVAGVATWLLMWFAFWTWIRRDYGRPVWFLKRRATPEPSAQPS